MVPTLRSMDSTVSPVDDGSDVKAARRGATAWLAGSSGSRLLTTTSIISAILGLGAALILVTSRIANIQGVETIVVHTVQEMLAGRPLYPDTASPPFMMTQYSPAYYIVLAGVTQLLGVSPNEPIVITLVGRFLSWGALLGTLVVVYGISISVLRTDRKVAFLAAAFFMLATSPWNYLARPDSLLIFVTACAMAGMLVDSSAPQGHRAGLVAGLGFAFLAPWVKQNGLILPIICIGYLIACRRWRAAAIAAAGGAALSAALVGICIAHWGDAFLVNVVDGLKNRIDIRNFVRQAFLPFFDRFLILALVVGAIWWSWRASPTRTQRLLIIAGVVCVASATVAALKRGSRINYYHEFILMGTITVVAQLSRDDSLSQLLRRSAPVLLSGWLPYLALVHSLYYLNRIPREQAWQRTRARVAMEARAKCGNHWIVSEDDSLQNFLFPYALAPQQSVVDQIFIDGIVSKQRLMALQDTGRIPCVVTQGVTPTRRWMDASKYCLDSEKHGFRFFTFCGDHGKKGAQPQP